MIDQTIQKSYDETPYPTVPRRQTHPNHLAALATLFGLNPAPVERCRVLDVGCADGGNLIPMAYQLPESEFVGLDFSAKQVAAGQAQVEALGLKNISLKTQDILEVEADLGRFDYIIVYGVYSWVPPEVQEKVLEICRRRLNPNGVAYISYNVYPGWHMHGLVRAVMLHHTRTAAEPDERVKKARSILDFYRETVPKLSTTLPDALKASHIIFESLGKLLEDQPDEYLLHDHLEAINEPLHLYEFVERIERHGLQYLTDAEAPAMLKRYLPAQFIRSIQDIAPTDLELEQLMDFLYMRAFRQTLLCRQEAALDRDITAERLKTLYIASSVKPAGETATIRSTAEAQFKGPIGVTITANQPLTKAALLCLAEMWPQPTPFEKLLHMARTRLNPDASLIYSAANLAQDVETLGNLLLKGYGLNLVEFHAYAPRFTLEISEYPTASEIVRFQAQEDGHLTNQRHEIIRIDDEISRYLLPYLDGRHNQAALVDKLVDLVESGALMVQPGGEPVADDRQLRDILADVLDRSLRKLAREAVLVG